MVRESLTGLVGLSRERDPSGRRLAKKGFLGIMLLIFAASGYCMIKNDPQTIRYLHGRGSKYESAIQAGIDRDQSVFFGRYDTNKDGIIDSAEFRAVSEKYFRR